MKINKLFSIALNVVMIVFFILSALLAVIAVVSRITSKSDIVMLFGHGFLVVETDSMAPEINEGAIVIVRKTTPENLRRGSIITFRSGGIVNTHKIVEIDFTGKSIVTRGVNAPANDDPISFDDVIGRVIGHSDAFGAFVRFLKSGYGFLLFLLLPAGVLLLFATLNFTAMLKKYKLQNEHRMTVTEEVLWQIDSMWISIRELNAMLAQEKRPIDEEKEDKEDF